MKKILALFTFFTLLTVNIALANAHWDNPKSIRTYIEPNQKKELMKQAFAKWSQFTNDRIVFKYVQSPKDAQIKVVFVKDAEKASKIQNALGVTHHQSIGDRMVAATIEIADNAPGGAKLRNDAVYRVMVHEIGHAIGIFDHSLDPMSVMYYAKGSRNQALTKEDLKLLSKLYSW